MSLRCGPSRTMRASRADGAAAGRPAADRNPRRALQYSLVISKTAYADAEPLEGGADANRDVAELRGRLRGDRRGTPRLRAGGPGDRLRPRSVQLRRREPAWLSG